LLVDDLSADAFGAAMREIQQHPLDPADARRHAETFGVERFETGLRAALQALDAGAVAC
jgi:hypothetical protein